MNLIKNNSLTSNERKFALALHSSTETLGIGLTELNNPKNILHTSTLKIGRNLSNYLFRSIEEIFPSISWHQISQLAVATGPGGFTGTRLTIIFARTIAQQLRCPLKGVSSFELMAYRLIKQLNSHEANQPFWIMKNLERRGIVAGKYQLIKKQSNEDINNIQEIMKPHLINSNTKIFPSINAIEDVNEDTKRLLKIALKAYQNNENGEWEKVLPLYPTTPVNIN